MSASKIQFNPGALTPSATGLWSIQFDAAGNAYRVDDTGNAILMNGLSLHNQLNGRSAGSCHPMSAITGLDAALAAIETPHTFAARAETSQNFSSQSEIVTAWDAEILKHPKFDHSESTNPEQIEINHDGYIQVWVNSNFQLHVTNRVLLRTMVSLNWGWFPETTAYAYGRHQNYVDVLTASVNGVIMPVQDGDILRVHNQIAYNDDVATLGDQVNVSLRYSESSLVIRTLVEP